MSDLGVASTLASDGDTKDDVDRTYLPVPDIRPGTLIDRYVLVGKLGAGGMGVVYAAYDPQLDRKIAIKLVRDDERPSHDSRHDRLLREARAMARLDHPHVIRVYDAGVTDVRGRERVFVAMELVEGQSLAAWAKDRPWRAVLEACVAAGRGLAAAHAAGLVHRDFKPDNVLVDRADRARVGDFGLVGIAGEVSRDHALTEAGAVMGTPAFMAPEQQRGEAVDARADQYAFCLTVKTLVPAAPRWLAPILERGLRDAPADRYASLDEVLDAIDRRLRRRGRLGWAAAAVAIAAIAAFTLARSPGHAAPCGTLAGVWDDGARAALAAHGGSATAAALDRYARTWTVAEDARCHATHEGEAAQQRAACVELRRAQLGAVAKRLRDAPAEVLVDGVAIVEALPSPHDCDDPTTVALTVPSPADPALRARVAAVRAELSAADGYRETGRFDDAAKILGALKAEPFAPLQAELADARAALAAARGDSSAADPLYAEAIRTAASASYEYELVDAIVDRAFDLPDTTDALRWYDLAEGWMHRLGDPPELVAHVHGNRADTRRKAGDLAGAVADARAAYDSRRTHDGPTHPRTLNAAVNLGAALLAAGNEREARDVTEAALKAADGALDPDHHIIRALLHNVVGMDLRLHDPGAARVALDRLVAANVKIYGADAPEVRALREQMAGILDEQGQHADAVALLEAALHGAPPEEAIGIRHNLANAYSQAGRGDDAVAEAHRAIDALTAVVGPKHPALVGSRTMLGFIEYKNGALDHAEADLRAALALAATTLPPDSPAAANTHSSLALVLVGEHRYADAQAEAERAIALARDKKPAIEAEAQFALAQALDGQHRSGTAAAQRSLALRDQLHDAGEDRAAVAAWLAAHPR